MTNDYQIDIYSELSSLPVPSFLPRPVPQGPKPKRQLKYLFQTQDLYGNTWLVEQVRPTRHGFDVLFGQKEGEPLRISRLVYTKELRDFWEKNKSLHNGTLSDLPIGRTTIKRARHRLGFNQRKDVSKFWMDRIDDLKTMKTSDFAAKHNLSRWMVADMRSKLFGPSHRKVGWWKSRTVMQFLRSGVTCREIKAKLGISLTHASRLRSRARGIHKD